VLRAARAEGVERLVADPVRRLPDAERLELAERPPARLLQALAHGAGRRLLPLVDPPGRNLPAPRVRDEAVPPQQEDPARRIVDHAGRRRTRQAHQVVLEALAVGQLDVRERERDPGARVDDSLAVYGPPHRGPAY
jgi:hypothetical protein